MKYTIQIVGTEIKRTINADSVDDAVAAFHSSVELPQDGWIVIAGEDDTHKQYPIRKAAVHTEKHPKNAPKTELVIENSGTGTFLVILGIFCAFGGFGLAALREEGRIFLYGVILSIFCFFFSGIYFRLHENKQRLIDIQDQLNALRRDRAG